ncbi:MAG: hypothetical protein LBD84_03045 [Campylobacteraceae bacterium]|jgi:hypothetical protein|nr:hypothetical protein [Campylobacteraceae bacterium]
MDEVKFELKNGKLYIVIAVFVFFFLIGVWVLLHSDSPSLDINPTLVKISSLISLIFFTFVICFCIKTIFSRRVGLIVNKSGITDKASLLSFGFISKKSIKDARVEEVEHEYYLFVELLNKDKYLNDENDYILRLLKENIKKYDCEVVIPLSNLKCSFLEVEEAINIILKGNHGV